MDMLLQELLADFHEPAYAVRVVVRLIVASVLGAVLGFVRLVEKKQARIRTHMLVAIGAALFAIAAVEAGDKHPHLTPVIQGVAVGVGFLGTGLIIKHETQKPRDESIHGLNSAAAIWLTAGTGIAVGAGLLWVALLSTVLTSTFMLLSHGIESKVEKTEDSTP